MSPYSQREGKRKVPGPSRLGDLSHRLDLVYLRHLRPWESCARRRSDNLWIKLSLTLPLMKDILLQAHSAALLIGDEANPVALHLDPPSV